MHEARDVDLPFAQVELPGAAPFQVELLRSFLEALHWQQHLVELRILVQL